MTSLSRLFRNRCADFLCELHSSSSLRRRCFTLCESPSVKNWQTVAAAFMHLLLREWGWCDCVCVCVCEHWWCHFDPWTCEHQGDIFSLLSCCFRRYDAKYMIQSWWKVKWPPRGAVCSVIMCSWWVTWTFRYETEFLLHFRGNVMKYLIIIWSVCVQILPPVRWSTPETTWSWKWRTPWSVMWLGSFLLLWSSPGPRTDRKWLKEPASTFLTWTKTEPTTSSPNWTSPPNKETSTAAQWPIQPWSSHRPGSGVRNFRNTDDFI